jgi:hypothetical protein
LRATFPKGAGRHDCTLGVSGPDSFTGKGLGDETGQGQRLEGNDDRHQNVIVLS